MYLVSLPPKGSGSRARRLLDALVEAKGRGVEVRVVLDRNAVWIEKRNKNAVAYRYLQERGVTVFYDDENKLTHAKALVIDGKTVILGSTNWSEGALTRNAEANLLVRSEGLAREMLGNFKEPAPRAGSGDVVRVPWAFLNNRKLLGRMASGRDEGAFDLYLFLLKSFDGNGEGKVVLNYPAAAGAIGIGLERKGVYQDALREVLSRLQDRYRLISFTFMKNRDPVILLKAMGEEFVETPAAYWDWGWSRRLALSGKVMLLLGMRYSSFSPMEPVWFRSQESLSGTHGISRHFINDGLLSLRRHNLIEVQPDRLNPASFGNRKANKYTPNPLYDPQELEKAFQALEQRYGQNKLQRAAGILHLIYEDSDARAAERLILLEEEFGPEAVREAAEKVGEMSGNNPKKTVGYLIATIKSIGGGGQRNLTEAPSQSTL